MIPLGEATRAWFAIPGLGPTKSHGAAGGPAPLISDDALHHEPPSRRRSASVLAFGMMFWRGWTPWRTLGLCALVGLGVYATPLLG